VAVDKGTVPDHIGGMASSCPICQKPSTAKSTPFCSERCRAVDMNRWFSGGYAVPAVELDDVDVESFENPEKPDDF